MKFAFQMDLLNKINFSTDSTWQLMLEGSKRGEIYHYTPNDLFWRNGEVLGMVRQVIIAEGGSYSLKEPKIINLAEFDVCFIRQDPPYDMQYLSTTYLLEKIIDKTLIINNPKAIRDFPEKILVLDFLEYIPPTLITSSSKEALNFAKDYENVIAKPLYGFAGSDVFCINANQPDFTKIVDSLIETHKTPIIIQNFIKEVSAGDKRIILCDGEPVGAFNRIPQAGDIKANLACGGTAAPCTLTKRDIEICTKLKPILQKHGLFFVGIDVIAGYLTEINVTSPTGIVQAELYYNPKLTENLWNLIINKLQTAKAK